MPIHMCVLMVDFIDSTPGLSSMFGKPGEGGHTFTLTNRHCIQCNGGFSFIIFTSRRDGSVHRSIHGILALVDHLVLLIDLEAVSSYGDSPGDTHWNLGPGIPTW